MHYLTPSRTGATCSALRAQLGYVQGFGGDVAPPNNRFYAGGEAELRGFDVRGATPYGYVPNRVNVQLTNPDGSLRSARSQQSAVATSASRCRCRSTASLPSAAIPASPPTLEYRIPIVGPVTFSFFDDFGIDVATNQRPVEAEPGGLCLADRAALRLPGLQQRLLPGRHPGLEGRIPAETSAPSPAPTSFRACRWAASFRSSCPSSMRRSGSTTPTTRCGCIERPFATTCCSAARQSCSAQLITRDLFPPGGAGDYTYGEAIQAYGAQNLFREPRKTFRLTVSTTF